MDNLLLKVVPAITVHVQVSAAVMSSTDSSMLSASTMIARNFYNKVIRPKASDREIIYVLWVCIIINCGIATTLAIVYRSIYDLL